MPTSPSSALAESDGKMPDWAALGPHLTTQQWFGDGSSASFGTENLLVIHTNMSSIQKFQLYGNSSYGGVSANFWTPVSPRCVCFWCHHAACTTALLTWFSLASGQDLTNSNYLRSKLQMALFQQRATPWLATWNGHTWVMSVQKTNCQKYRHMDLSGFWSVEKSQIHQLRSLAYVTYLNDVNFQR